VDTVCADSSDNCGGCDFGQVIEIGNESRGSWTGRHRHSAIHIVSTYNFQRRRIMRRPSYFFGAVDRGLDGLHLPLIVKVELEGFDRHGRRLPALLRNRPGQMLLHQLLDFSPVVVRCRLDPMVLRTKVRLSACLPELASDWLDGFGPRPAGWTISTCDEKTANWPASPGRG
jgi:hypothetical protein